MSCAAVGRVSLGHRCTVQQVYIQPHCQGCIAKLPVWAKLPVCDLDRVQGLAAHRGAECHRRAAKSALGLKYAVSRLPSWCRRDAAEGRVMTQAHTVRQRSLWRRITRSTLFWPGLILVGPRIPRLAAVLVLTLSSSGRASEGQLATPAGEPGQAASTDICEEEHAECTKYCRASYSGRHDKEVECLERCDENYDICVYEVYGGSDGCESDPETTELIACGVIVGSEIVCEAIASEGCDCSAEEEPSADSFAPDDGLVSDDAFDGADPARAEDDELAPLDSEQTPVALNPLAADSDGNDDSDGDTDAPGLAGQL